MRLARPESMEKPPVFAVAGKEPMYRLRPPGTVTTPREYTTLLLAVAVCHVYGVLLRSRVVLVKGGCVREVGAMRGGRSRFASDASMLRAHRFDTQSQLLLTLAPLYHLEPLRPLLGSLPYHDNTLEHSKAIQGLSTCFRVCFVSLPNFTPANPVMLTITKHTRGEWRRGKRGFPSAIGSVRLSSL